MDDQRIQSLVGRFSRPDDESRGAASIDRILQRLIAAGAARIGVGLKDDRVGCRDAAPLARMIDHTALKAETTVDEIRTLCAEARRYCFASVCVNPCYVALAAEWLAGTPVNACTVVGFPLGASRPETKAREADLAVRDGAREVDMVLNVGMLKSGEHDFVETDVRAVVDTVRGSGVITKVILETALLTDEEKVIACALSRSAGADFVKTSTGFSTGGATVSDVALMRRAVGDEMGVKAAGGIRSAEEAEALIASGASRIGASASVAIVRGVKGIADS